MEYIKHQISEDVAKKIIGNQANALAYLIELSQLKTVPELRVRTVGSGKNAGQLATSLSGGEIWKIIVDTWDYELSKQVIRQLFRQSLKYQRGKQADKVMASYIEQWQQLQLGDISWPFSQGDFDGFVQRVNSGSADGAAKDAETQRAAIKFRRIKEINTVRNDFIETLIFEKNANILPTLNHRRGVDFFIDGVSFDQKVAKSPTGEFKKAYGDNWRQTAITQPELVAQYLYRYQDEDRFDANPRLLVVYLDEDVSIDKIREIINSIDIQHPKEINFSFDHRTQGETQYKAQCFVVLLHN